MFYDKFTRLCRANDVLPSTVAESIGLSKSSATYWKKGAMPKYETIKKLADYFGVRTTFFLDDSDRRGIEDAIRIMAPNDSERQEKLRSSLAEGAIKTQYYERIDDTIIACNELLARKSGNITDYFLRERLYEQFRCLDRAGKMKAIEYLILLNETGLFKIPDVADPDTPTDGPDEKSDEE